MEKSLNILLLFDSPFEASPDYDYTEELKHPDWSAEKRILNCLRDLGHKVSLLGIFKKIEPLIDEINKNKPDLVFNSADVFKQKTNFDKNIAWLLDMLEVPYTGASPVSLMICNHKGLNKKILSYHKIKVPNFCTYYRHRKIKPFKKLKFPCVVKPISEEASRGISQASVVDNPKNLLDRVQYINKKMNHDAIAEEYIEGREFYVGILGNKRLQALPLREMTFGKLPDDEPRIATYKAKWDKEYRKKWRLDNIPAKNISPENIKQAHDVCKRAYRALNMQSYARFDIRITPENKIYILEPNANPSLQPNDEFVLAAKKAGISFSLLIKTIIKLAFQRST